MVFLALGTPALALLATSCSLALTFFLAVLFFSILLLKLVGPSGSSLEIHDFTTISPFCNWSQFAAGSFASSLFSTVR